MINIILQDQVRLIAFWLCFTRWVCIIFQLPIFDQFAIPSLVKILTSFMIAFAFFENLEASIIADFGIISHDHFWILTLYQAMVGLSIGYLVKVIITIYISAGSLISQQMGYGAIQYFDHNVQQSVGSIEKLIQWVVLILILKTRALYPMFLGGFKSFNSISLVNLSKISSMPHYFIDLFISLFESAVLLASPIIFVNIFLVCIIGIVGRFVPQVNVLMISFVVNIGVGLFVLIVTSDDLFQVAYHQYVDYLGRWFQYLR